MTKRDELLVVASLIEGAPTRWLPAAGYVKSFTFTLDESDQIATSLRLSAQQREPVVRVEELEWTSVFGRPATRAESLSSIGLYIIADLDGTGRFSVGLDNVACAAFLLDEAGNKQLRYSSIHEAAAAAQADYEQRIMAAIEIQTLAHSSTVEPTAHNSSDAGSNPAAPTSSQRLDRLASGRR